jgi:hypothetical protein
MIEADYDAEHRLAVLTSWALFGSIGLGLVATGFRAESLMVAGAGYAVLIAGFVSHLVINRIYLRDFRPGEIATAITLFGVAALSFLASWAFSPGFSARDVEIGILGLGLIAAGFVVYLTARHGLTGAFSMFHPDRGPPNGSGRRD